MFSRLCRHLLLVIAFAASALAPAADAQSVAPSDARIIAVGDLHGDFNAWRQIATGAGLMDAKGHWAGGKTILVQTGDVPDRGPDTLKIITDLRRLQKEAPRTGGQVFALIGNHEAMNVIGDLRYVSAGDFAAFATPHSENLRDQYFESNRRSIMDAYRQQGDTKLTDIQIRDTWYALHPLGRIEHQIAWGPKGRIGKWIVTHPAVLQLGDMLFVHGGISLGYADKSIDAINSSVKQALIERDTDMASIINDPAGPLWYRGLAQKDEVPPPVEVELEAVLKAHGARRIVIGHTPQLAGISRRQNDRLILIDTGISAVFGGAVSWLEIRGDTLIAHEIPRAIVPVSRPAKGAPKP